MLKNNRSRLNSKEVALFVAPLMVLLFVLITSKAKPLLQKRITQNLSPSPTSQPPKRGINSISFSPDGQKFATGSQDGYVKVWNAQRGTLHQTLLHKNQWVSSVAFSPNGRMLAGTSGRSLYLWSVPSGQLLKVLTAIHPSISSVAFSPNNELVAVGCGTGGLYKGSGAINVWNVKTGKPEAVLKGNTAYVGSVAFSPDGQSLAASCGTMRGTPAKPKPRAVDLLRLWNVKRKTLTWEVQGGFAEADAAFSPDGKLVAIGGSVPELFFAQNGKPAAPVTHAWQGGAWHITFSRDSQVLVSGGVGIPLTFSETSNGKTIDFGNGLDHYYANSLVFSLDGKRLASADSSGKVKIWDMRQLNQMRKSANPQLSSHLPLLMTLDTVTGQVVEPKIHTNNR